MGDNFMNWLGLSVSSLTKGLNEPYKLQLVKTFIVCYFNYCPLV